MKKNINNTASRLYYLDWLKVLAMIVPLPIDAIRCVVSSHLNNKPECAVFKSAARPAS